MGIKGDNAGVGNNLGLKAFQNSVERYTDFFPGPICSSKVIRWQLIENV